MFMNFSNTSVTASKLWNF